MSDETKTEGKQLTAAETVKRVKRAVIEMVDGKKTMPARPSRGCVRSTAMLRRQPPNQRPHAATATPPCCRRAVRSGL